MNTTCEFKPCGRPASHKGLCIGHYRQRQVGKELRKLRADVSPLERFMSSFIVIESGCWEWQKGTYASGYAQFAPHRQSVAAYRWGYTQIVGPVPPGLQLDHLCRNRKCVNPEHLEPVTAKVNNLRSTSPAAKNAVKTHCDHGHEFTPENTIYSKTGSRSCRECGRRRCIEYKARLRNGPKQDNKNRTHCKRGHPFDQENTIIINKGGKPGRLCRTCRDFRKSKKG